MTVQVKSDSLVGRDGDSFYGVFQQGYGFVVCCFNCSRQSSIVMFANGGNRPHYGIFLVLLLGAVTLCTEVGVRSLGLAVCGVEIDEGTTRNGDGSRTVSTVSVIAV